MIRQMQKNNGIMSVNIPRHLFVGGGVVYSVLIYRFPWVIQIWCRPLSHRHHEKGGEIGQNPNRKVPFLSCG